VKIFFLVCEKARMKLFVMIFISVSLIGNHLKDLKWTSNEPFPMQIDKYRFALCDSPIGWKHCLMIFRYDHLTNSTEWINHTVMSVLPTDLRMDLDYVFFYNNLTKLVITGVIPFVALCVFNFKIYSALRRRRQVFWFVWLIRSPQYHY